MVAQQPSPELRGLYLCPRARYRHCTSHTLCSMLLSGRSLEGKAPGPLLPPQSGGNMITGNSSTPCRFDLGLLLRTGAIVLRTTVRLERAHSLNSNYVNSEKKVRCRRRRILNFRFDFSISGGRRELFSNRNLIFTFQFSVWRPSKPKIGSAWISIFGLHLCIGTPSTHLLLHGRFLASCPSCSNKTCRQD